MGLQASSMWLLGLFQALRIAEITAISYPSNVVIRYSRGDFHSIQQNKVQILYVHYDITFGINNM